eukprot:3708864-Pyramimonas_sp.AAC.1
MHGHIAKKARVAHTVSDDNGRGNQTMIRQRRNGFGNDTTASATDSRQQGFRQQTLMTADGFGNKHRHFYNS